LKHPHPTLPHAFARGREENSYSPKLRGPSCRERAWMAAARVRTGLGSAPRAKDLGEPARPSAGMSAMARERLQDHVVRHRRVCRRRSRRARARGALRLAGIGPASCDRPSAWPVRGRRAVRPVSIISTMRPVPMNARGAQRLAPGRRRRCRAAPRAAGRRRSCRRPRTWHADADLQPGRRSRRPCSARHHRPACRIAGPSSTRCHMRLCSTVAKGRRAPCARKGRARRRNARRPPVSTSNAHRRVEPPAPPHPARPISGVV